MSIAEQRFDLFWLHECFVVVVVAFSFFFLFFFISEPIPMSTRNSKK
jgi:hypothetical protein